MKLCLGTAQLGMGYGIRGGAKPSLSAALSLLDIAVERGVDAMDTATAYGDAEAVLGRFFDSRPEVRDGVSVVSKFGMGVFDGAGRHEYPDRLRRAALESLARIGKDRLYGYLCHVPDAVRNEAVISAMAEVRRAGLAEHVGVSVYEVDEAVSAINSGVVDLLQVPFSVFDQRMLCAGVLEMAARRGVEVHSRSAFVQGLALMDVEEVPDWLPGARRLVADLESLCAASGTTRRRLALAFVRRRGGISRLVFGVDGAVQLGEILDDFAASVPSQAIDEAERMFAEVDPRLVMPNKWRKQ